MLRSLQMKSDLIEILRKVVERFQLSSETYYHSILLFNIVKLKKDEKDYQQFYKIPVRIRKNKGRENFSKDQQDEDVSLPSIEYITVPHSEMPERDKIHMTVCLFLAHKLYEPYQLFLSSLIRYIGIPDRFQEYIVSLQIQFFYLLKFKIENLLPSNQTLIACQNWDLFMKNISNSCVDVKFGIMEILESSQKQNTYQTSSKITSESKKVQNQQNIESLARNIQIIVHNQAIYELYLQKSKNQGSSNLHPMQKIGIAILYLTILHQSSMIFIKKIGVQKKNSQFFQTKNTGFLDFVFEDFLKSQYGIALNKLKDQITVARSILQETKKKSSKGSCKEKIYTIKNLDEVKQKSLVEFLLKLKQKSMSEKKGKENRSISSIKTGKKQDESFMDESKKGKCYSIINFADKKDKILESTVHTSIRSQKSNTYVSSFISSKQGTQIVKNDLTKKQTQSLMNQFEKKLTRTNTKKNSCTYKKTSLSFKNEPQQHQEFKVSSFTPFDA